MPSSACKKRARSEEHTSELQSHSHLVCRLLLEKNNHSQGRDADGPGGALAFDTRAQRSGLRRLAGVGDLRARGLASCTAALTPDRFFFNDTAPTEIYPLPLPDALPIGAPGSKDGACEIGRIAADAAHHSYPVPGRDRKSTRLNSSHTLISYAVFCL